MTNTTRNTIVSVLALATAPGLVSAMPAAMPVANDLGELIGWIQSFINALLPVILGFAVLFFFYGLVKYVLNANDPGAQGEARGMMIWGVIIIFIMISLWGLVNILVNTFGFQNSLDDNDIPMAPGVVRTISPSGLSD